MLPYPVPLGPALSWDLNGNATVMFVAYRVIYGIFAAFVLANLLNTHYYGAVPGSTSWLVLACKLSLVALILGTLALSRIKLLLVWGIILVWEGLFIWYAWFSPGAPFTIYFTRATAIVLFASLFLWFMSLGFMRTSRASSAPTEGGERMLP